MSIFKIDVIAINPKNEEIKTPPIETLVDTGSELTWLPKEMLLKIGIKPRRKKYFMTATGQRVGRDIGYAILTAQGYETNDEIVFAEKDDMILLGVRTLEGFGVTVDSVGHRLIAQTTLVAASF